MFKQKKIVGLFASVGLVASMALATQSMAAQHSMQNYAVDGARGMVMNSDGKCWDTAGGVPAPQAACGDVLMVEEVVVEVDSDGDGVLDSMDKCPGTRAGASVDQWGCEIVANLVIDLVEGEFDFDSAELKPGTKAALDDLANRIKSSEGSEMLTITGHTDSTGPEDYNMGLSVRRAQSAADYLGDQGIGGITVKGMGESNPIADNATRQGRAENRRIEVTTN